MQLTWSWHNSTVYIPGVMNGYRTSTPSPKPTAKLWPARHCSHTIVPASRIAQRHWESQSVTECVTGVRRDIKIWGQKWIKWKIYISGSQTLWHASKPLMFRVVPGICSSVKLPCNITHLISSMVISLPRSPALVFEKGWSCLAGTANSTGLAVLDRKLMAGYK